MTIVVTWVSFNWMINNTCKRSIEEERSHLLLSNRFKQEMIVYLVVPMPHNTTSSDKYSCLVTDSIASPLSCKLINTMTFSCQCDRG